MEDLYVANTASAVVPDSNPVVDKGYAPMQENYKPAHSPILDVGKVGDTEMAIDMRSGDKPVAKTLLYKDL